jgi:hypothetical protein
MELIGLLSPLRWAGPTGMERSTLNRTVTVTGDSLSPEITLAMGTPALTPAEQAGLGGRGESPEQENAADGAKRLLR